MLKDLLKIEIYLFNFLTNKPQVLRFILKVLLNFFQKIAGCGTESHGLSNFSF